MIEARHAFPGTRDRGVLANRTLAGPLRPSIVHAAQADPVPTDRHRTFGYHWSDGSGR
jgi:hypothetical protein